MKNERNQNAFKVFRNPNGLQLDVKTKTRDKNVPPHITIDVLSAMDQITDQMDHSERVKAYYLLMGKI